MNTCKTVLASTVSKHFRNRIKREISERNIRPKLVGFLANEDPASKKYAEQTAKTLKETGFDFNLIKVDKGQLESSIQRANLDSDVNGIMVYYPVFGDQIDTKLKNTVDSFKDIEGLRHVSAKKERNTVPCTPLAVIKILEFIGAYKSDLLHGQRLKDHTVTIINRSEIAGQPLAALLANDGATVYSVDEHSVQVLTKTHKQEDTELKIFQVLPKSDIVITGVPAPKYKLPTELLKPGVIAINFSTFANFEPDVVSKASYFVPSVGKMTVAMLEKNLLTLYNHQNPHHTRP
ncbi:uncharacterized protein EV154DRAFT_542035 [Mucor mucedo]|uniref:uncharacterized protein n=1 Tax=Mucor mucedo TaxID=29922 RepID=UPI00221E7C26|nr:uncharacterized protein EV154DRAFT_542035 [Mucor mucedo]KAI7895386.1 hypothetical protein EV154DRAFT_542035 [Mucor mucedo]